MRRSTPCGRRNAEKTFIGRIERAFDFLGYHFSALGLTVLKEILK
jgi:hypothetical protein